MTGEDQQLVFRVKGWIDTEDFKRLLRIADYLGRERGYSLFRLSKNKILASGRSADEILSILDDVSAEYSAELEEFIDEILSSGLGEATITFDGSKLYVKFNRYLGDLYRGNLRNLLRYDHESRMFCCEPYVYHELKDELNRLGFRVTDLTGFKEDLRLGFNLRFEGKLRDYQEEALKYWLRNSGRGIVALPTGSGKTVIGIASVVRVRQRTLIIAYTKEQLVQWRQAILKFTNIPEYALGLYYSREKRIAPITLATYQTAYKHVLNLLPHYNHLIIDEVHHLPADKFKVIASKMPARYRIGLSATPYREDGKHAILFPLMGGVIYYRTPQELAERGYLARYRIITVKVPLTPAERRRYEELRKAYKSVVGYTDFATVLEAARKGDHRAMQALRIHSEIRQLVQKSSAKVRKVEEIINDELERGSKIIVFAHYVDLAKKIAEKVGGYLLTGEMDIRERRAVLEKFRNAESGVLVVTTVGDEGLDIPDANVGILIAGTGSRRQFIQRLGRLLRPGKEEARLYEIVAKGTPEEYQSRRRKQTRLET